MKNRNSKKKGYSSETMNSFLTVHLSEYEQLRNEIGVFVSDIASATNYSLIITAALITFLPQAIKDFGNFVLLMAPLPFWGLIWYLLSLDSLITRNSGYIKWVLAPKINKTLNDNDELKDSPELRQKVFEWERYASFHDETFGEMVRRGIVSSGRSVIVFLPILFCIGTFIYLTRIVSFHPWSSGEISLLIVNAFCLLWFMVLGLLVLGQYTKQPKLNNESKNNAASKSKTG